MPPRLRNSTSSTVGTPAKGGGVSVSVGEKVLKELRNAYEQDGGLISIFKHCHKDLLPPREKITCLLVGNHSAGKSSFINWYIEEQIQREGVAMETSGFTFVTSGKKKKTLTGPATMVAFPHFCPLSDNAAVIFTQISTSKQKRFPLITFVDTPGLVDGDMSYGEGFDQSLLWLGNLADVIFVFFDPIGQALCKHTVDIVEEMNKQCGTKHTQKLRFFLSKADAAGSSVERQKVVGQIIQNLCRRPGLNNIALEIPTIFIPQDQDDSVPNPHRDSCPNQIDDACRILDETINQMVQNSLNQFETDCNTAIESVETILKQDTEAGKHNTTVRLRGMILLWLGLLIPVLSGFALFVFLLGSKLPSLVGPEWAGSFQSVADVCRSAYNLVPEESRWTFVAVAASVSFLSLLAARLVWHTKARLSSREIKRYKQEREDAEGMLATHHKALYAEYLGDAVGETAI